MADTFGALWRQAKLHCPAVPTLLVQEWARITWQEAMDAKDWSFRRALTDFRTMASVTGTFTITLGASSGTAGTLAVVSTDVGRQLRVDGLPLYTILAVSGSTITLDRPWREASLSAATTRILSAYVTMPSDFARAAECVDTAANRRLRLFIQSDEVHHADPARLLAGDPRCLVPTTLDPTTASLGYPRYELWPYLYTARTYHLRYFKQIADPTDAYLFPTVFTKRRRVLLDGILRYAAAWPGTITQKNPYFNLVLAEALSTRFAVGLDEAMFDDENLAPTWLGTLPLDSEHAGISSSTTPTPAYDDTLWP